MALMKVTTKYGEIEGLAGWNQAVSVFRGIPYAKAPKGELRWKPPVDPEPWEGTYKAYNWGAICYQERRSSEGGGDLIGNEFYCVDWPRDEDCLFLNVWTPAKSAGERLPVGVYLHGGGYSQGYGHLNCYDGEGFAKRGCVIVTLNHRLGVFGYLAHPELTAEDVHHSSGNYGVLDIIQALKWVRENIAAFGGDPEHITVFGQSGGAHKVAHMLATPLTDGLICGAIMQSGGGLNVTRSPKKLESAEAMGVDFLRSIGCGSIEEARKISQEELLLHVRKYIVENDLNPMGVFEPVTDGYIFPDNFMDLFCEGRFKDIPTMIGCTSEEFVGDKNVSRGVDYLPSREKAFKDGANLVGEDNAELFLKAIHYDDDPKIAAEMYRTLVFGTGATYAGNIAFCEAQVRNKHKPTYQYYLTLVPPAAKTAHHSAEHQYVFQTLTKSMRPYTGRDWDLSNQLADYWANFIKTGNPNGETVPEWTPYTADCRQAMDIDYDLHMINENTNDFVDFLVKFDLKEI